MFPRSARVTGVQDLRLYSFTQRRDMGPHPPQTPPPSDSTPLCLHSQACHCLNIPQNSWTAAALLPGNGATDSVIQGVTARMRGREVDTNLPDTLHGSHAAVCHGGSQCHSTAQWAQKVSRSSAKKKSTETSYCWQSVVFNGSFVSAGNYD